MRIEPPPFSTSALFEDQAALSRSLARFLNHPLVRRINAKYRPWQKVRHIAEQEGVDALDLWRAVKVTRLAAWRQFEELTRMEGGHFGFCKLPEFEQLLHQIDLRAGATVAAGSEEAAHVMTDPGARERFIVRSLMDEAIESSRIEGAVTTREHARELLRSGREAKTSHERMVANNYAAMQKIKAWLGRELTVDMLLELQTILTRGTLPRPDQAGRLRRPGEDVAVWDSRTNDLVFRPPPAEGLHERLQRICDFANREHTGAEFVHPVVKASILHFMIGYEHPFCDGNGRTARAVFYWSVLRAGYRLFEFLVISELIRKSYARYPRAYLDTETDEGDLTYFVHYKLRVIGMAIDRLSEYLRQEQKRVRQSLELTRVDSSLNLRQRLLIEHALRHPNTVYTVQSHATTSRVTPGTARADLTALVQRGLFSTFKSGKQVQYVLSPDALWRLGAKER